MEYTTTKNDLECIKVDGKLLNIDYLIGLFVGITLRHFQLTPGQTAQLHLWLTKRLKATPENHPSSTAQV